MENVETLGLHGALCGDLPGDGLQDDVESTSLPTRVTVDDPQHGMYPGWPGRGKGTGKPTPRSQPPPPPPPPPPPRAGGEGMFRPFPAQGLPGVAQGQFYRPVRVELTVGGVPMVGYRQGIPGVDYSIELTMRKPDQPDQRPAAEPPIVGKMGTTATGPSSASAGASSASSRAPTTEIPGSSSASSRAPATESQPTAASAPSASSTENRANAASAPSANPAYSRLGVVAERVMPDGSRVIYRNPRETYYENVPPPTSSASAPTDPPTVDSPGPGEPEPEAEDLTVEETSSDVEVVRPTKVMRKDGSHGAALPAELCHQDRAQHLCDGGLQDSRECHGGRAWQPPAGKDHGVCVCLDTRAWHLHDGECHGSGVCLDTRAEHLQGCVCLGAGECPDTRASQPCDPVCGDAWAPLLCCATCHLWAPRPSLGLAPRPSLGMTTNGWACDGDECGGGGSDDRYDDRYDEKYDDVGLLHGRALQPLCGEALLGFNGAARDTPGPGGAETLEEIYGCDWAALLPGHQGPAALPGRGHLPSCMRPVWPILNEDQVCEVGKNGWHMTPNAVQDVQLFLGFSHPHADPCSCVASANGSEKRAVPYNVKPQGLSELIGAKEYSDSSQINSLTGDQISRHQSGPVGSKNDEFLQGSGAQLKIQVRSVNTSLEGSKSSAGAESRVAVAPVEGMSAYGGSCSGSLVAAMLFALPTLVAGQPGDGGRRDQDGDFGAYLFFFVLLAGYTAMVILGVLACIWCQQLHGERRQVGGKGAGKGRAYSNREMDEWYGNDVANIHYSDEEAMPTPRLRRRRTTGSSSRGSGDGRTTSPAYSEADGPPIQDPEREPFNLWRSPDEFEEDDMPAIPEDYVPTPSTPDHWVPMSTRIQERRDRAEDARGGKGKGKEKGKEKGGREIFRPGQGARLRPATPSPSVCPAEESQEETSVASTPGTADVTPDEEEEEEADPAIPFPHGAKAPPAAWMQGQRPPGQPQGSFPTTAGPTRASSDATGANWASATT